MSDFHAHLDVCQQCARNPMNLCPVGADLLRRAVEIERVRFWFSVGANEMFR